jgi:hypothetical protein
MAAVTPTSVKQISVGSTKGIIASFAATTDDADTWASAIDDIVFVSATQADTAGTQASTGAGASFSGSTVTFHLGEDNSAVELLVLSGSAL